jgi:hypothetical protein
MKPKQLIPFVVILAVLGGLVFWKQSQQEKPSIVKQANLAELVPASLKKNAVTRIALYSGNAAEDKVTLEKSGDTWTVASHFNAPATQDKVNEYLDLLLNLKGEARDTATEDSKLDVYELKDDQAFHVEIFAGSESPAFHLLVGKAPDHRSVFLRTADAKDIYVEAKDPRKEAGITTTGEEAKPDATHWFDKDILKLEQDRIKRVALTLPDKSLVLERTEKMPEPPAEEEASEDAETEATPPPPAVPEIVWELASGGPGIPLKTPGVDSVLQKIATFVATDIVDPAKKAEWGLDAPAYRAEIALEGDENIVLEAGRPDPTGDAYVRVASSDNDVVYQVNKFNFERLFAKGSQLFDLPKQTVAQEQMESITISGPDGSMILQKQGQWKLVSPPSDLELQTSTVNNLVSTLANLIPNDYADESTDIGAVTHTISVTAAGETHTVRIAGASKSSDGHYVQLEGNPMKLAISQNDVAKLTLQVRDILNRKIFDVPVGNATAVGINHNGAGFSLSKIGENWERNIPGQDALPLDTQLVDDVLFGIDELQVDNIRSDVDPATLAFDTNITIRYDDDQSLEVNFTAAQDNMRLMTTSAKGGVFSVKEEDLAAVLGPIVAIRDAGSESEAASETSTEVEIDPAAMPENAPEITIEPADTTTVTPEITITPESGVTQPLVVAPAPATEEN